MFFRKKENKTSIISKLKSGLEKTSNKLTESLNVISNKKLDEETLNELEESLIISDLGIKTASLLTDKIRKNRFNKDITIDELKSILSKEIFEILSPCQDIIRITKKPQVIMFCGVNGNGKTTTIGKLSSKFKQEGKKVMMVACDTFRAAAVEQLQIWSERTNSIFVSGEINSDPASVAYKAIEQAKEGDIDIVLIDTAGRLQNKDNLMQELSKIKRVIQKHDESYPHQTILVLDATTGQNTFSQIKSFNELIEVDGLIITKLDGTARGGSVIGICEEFKKKIYAIGIGEKIEDLKDFDAQEFSESILGINS